MAKRAPGAASASTARWAELSRTATAVRAGSPHAAVDLPAPWWRRRAGAALGGGAIAAALTLSGLQMGDATVHAQADGGLDSRLFSLTNQDRASNGVRSLSYNGTLQSVGEGGAYHCGGITVYGRSVDMIQRNYFSHVIPVCNQYVFPMMSAFGINYQTTPDWEKAAMEFTGGTGVDHVVEVGGAATLTRSFSAIRVGGKVTLIGGLSGGASELNPALIFARRANVQGISVGSTEMFEAMNRAIAANAIKPVVDKVFDFAEVQAAYRHMAAGAHFGKIVIRIA